MQPAKNSKVACPLFLSIKQCEKGQATLWRGWCQTFRMQRRAHSSLPPGRNIWRKYYSHLLSFRHICGYE